LENDFDIPLIFKNTFFRAKIYSIKELKKIKENENIKYTFSA